MSDLVSVTDPTKSRTGDALLHGSQALSALRAIHELILVAADESTLVQDVCDALANRAAYSAAWVAYVRPEAATIEVIALAGAAAGEFEDLALMPADAEAGVTVVDALEQGRPWVVRASPAKPGTDAAAPPREQAVAVLPLRCGAATVGGLFVRAAGGAVIDEVELDLLHETARSLAYALASLRSAAELSRVNRARKTLSAVNRTLVRAVDEDALLGAICRIIVDDGGYRYAWVGYIRHDEDKGVEVKAHVGVDREHLEGLHLTWADSERGRSPTGVALRTGQPSIGRNIRTDPDLEPWRKEALRRGYAAISAFPLRIGGEIVGNLSIAATEADAFDAAEADLLGELAGDLAFGIETLRTRKRSHEAEATIKRMAEEDTLTGLPNRWRMRMRLEEEIGRAKADNRPLAVLMIGIDHFQEINETLGYQQGDTMLCEIADRLKRLLDDRAKLARMGESEFAVMLPGKDAGAASRMAQGILAELLEPVAIGEVLLDARGSIGIAVFPGHGAEPDVLIRRANVAMHQARKQGDGHTLYTGGRDLECARRLSLIGDLHRAIASSELRLYCQPKVRFSNREICGVEALVRWQHPQLGMISPEEFIGLAESSGLISPLTNWMMDAAFRQGYAWREAGLQVPMAVNLSARDLRDPTLAERVRNLLVTWGDEPGAVQFELTESALMQEPKAALQTMRRLKDLGIELFIDDFGTGYSSLAYLQKLPVDAIKIDQSFVRAMLADHDSAVIVRSTIDLAHDLDLEVVAEGVEDRASWDHLAAEGCDIAQGFVVSEPLPAEGFEQWRAADSFAARMA